MARFEMTVIYDESIDEFEVVSADEPVIDETGISRECEAWAEGETLDWAIDHVKQSLGGAR